MAPSDDDAMKFGKLVRRMREALGLTQDAVAIAAFPPSGERSRISKIENAVRPHITPNTARIVASVLNIDRDEVPLSLRWIEATEEVKSTNTLAHEIQEQLSKLVAAQTDRSREFGIKEGMLIALARRYAEGAPDDFEAALAGLDRALEVARDERKNGRLPSNLSEAVDAVIARIDTLNEKGDLDGGQAALDAELAALDEEDERRRAERARLYDKGIAQAYLTRSVEHASRFVVARFDLDAPTNPDERLRLFSELLDEWQRRGVDRGLNFDLAVTIALGREGVRRAETIYQRGAMQTKLGIALWRLGERESVPARLEEAVAILRAVLVEWTQKQEARMQKNVPLDWAETMHNLGNVLWTLGERMSDMAQLEEAVNVYRAALEERTRERVPLDWAATMNSLGNALTALGQRESGTERLKEAVAAFQLALEVWTQEQEPHRRAVALNNLGSALQTLGLRESSTARLEEAVAAFQLALEDCTQEETPFHWARVQNNLGNALTALGEREGGTEPLEEAIAAYQLALEEWTQERVPLDWALIQNNLGHTLIALGKRERGTARLKEAVAAFRLALEEWTQERVPLDWAMAQANLGNALTALGERESGTERLKEAVVAFRAALEEWTQERVPLDWAMAERDLNLVLKLISDRQS